MEFDEVCIQSIQLYSYLGYEERLSSSVVEFNEHSKRQLYTYAACNVHQTLYVKLANGCLLPPSFVTQFGERCT